MKWWWPTWRGLLHGWSQISFSSLICVWDEQRCWVTSARAHTHTNKQADRQEISNLIYRFIFLASTLPCSRISLAWVMDRIGKHSCSCVHVWLWMGQWVCVRVCLHVLIPKFVFVVWGMHNYKLHPSTHSHTATYIVQQRFSLLFTKEAETSAIDWLWEESRGECSLAIFEGHSAKCRPKSSVWGLVLWLDVKLVYSVHPGVESLNIIPCGQQYRQSALQADGCCIFFFTCWFIFRIGSSICWSWWLLTP